VAGATVEHGIPVSSFYIAYARPTIDLIVAGSAF
jgi:hypothetical protein